MKRFLVILGLFLATAASAHASGGWKTVAHKSVSGAFAVTAVNATVGHPRGLAVRLIGHVQSGNAVVACSKGFSVSSNGRQYSHAGTFKLPMMRGAASCDITASVGGSGKVTVQILKR